MVSFQHCVSGGACGLRGDSRYRRHSGIFWAIVAALVHLAFLVVMIIAIVKAFTGVRWDIPYIGQIARRQVEGAGG